MALFPGPVGLFGFGAGCGGRLVPGRGGPSAVKRWIEGNLGIRVMDRRGILVFRGFFRNFSGLNFKGCGL